MDRLIKTEELAMFLFSAWLFSTTGYAWWWFWVLLLSPDLSMAGYAMGPRFGAFLYNFFHHKALGLLLIFAGWYAITPGMTAAGLILFGHSSMDRLFGYGLKYADAFTHTHLGWIGKDRSGKKE